MFSRLRKSVLKRLSHLRHPDGYFISRTDGVRWLLNNRNFVDRQVGVFGGFEREQLEFLFSAVARKADVFIDIGANFGLYTLNAARRCIAETIVAFEPDPRNVAQLFGNLYLNGSVQFVQVCQAAVSDREGFVILRLEADNSTGTTRVLSNGEAGFQVQSVTIDGKFDWEKKIILIKIDIEGHEISALRGMERTLRSNSCFLQVDCFAENEARLSDFMASVGYRKSNRIDFDSYFCPVNLSFSAEDAAS